MKNIFSSIIILLVIIGISTNINCGNNKQEDKSDIKTSTDLGNPSCDSLYQGLCRNKSEDTIINGTKYAYAITLTEGFILAWREYNEEYRMYKNMELINNGIASILCDDSDHISDFYYDNIVDSPNQEYVFLCEYYETKNIENEDEIIIKFKNGVIYDIIKGKKAMVFYGGDTYGNWSYCNQWISDGKIVFDPIKNDK